MRIHYRNIRVIGNLPKKIARFGRSILQVRAFHKKNAVALRKPGKKLLRALPHPSPSQMAVDDYRVIGLSRSYHVIFLFLIFALAASLEGARFNLLKKSR